MRKSNLAFVILTLILALSLVACAQQETSKNGHITLQYIYYQTESGGLFFEEESLGIDHFELNGNTFREPPFTIYDLPGNQMYDYTVKAFDADGTLMASGSGQWMVVEGFTTPQTATLTVRHQHEFKTTWSSDATYHWHGTSCGHAATKDKSQHTFSGDICTVCGYDRHVHTYSSSWSSNDYTHWHAADCGHSLTKDSAEHSFGSDTVIVEPTCTTNGTGSHSCRICGKEVSYSIPATGHSYGNPVVVAPTCTEDGGTIYTCSVCGLKKTEKAAKTGHSYDLGVVTTAAGCTTDGVKTFTCLNCNDTYTTKIPATGHAYDDGVVTTAPGCTTKGVKTYTCANCSDSYTESIPATGHSYSSEWTTDDTYHWHEVTCEHTEEKGSYGAHAIPQYATAVLQSDGSYLFERTCPKCGYTVSSSTANIGDYGPAGGCIIYDCDADNDSGNADGLISTEVGWKYLEVAPADLRVIDGVPTVDSSLDGYSSAPEGYIFGYYRTSDNGDNFYVNGTTTYDVSNCTGTAVGTGKRNTQLLVYTMWEETYSSKSGSDKTADYAARLCDILSYDYNGETFDDWFLPSRDELDLIYGSKLYGSGKRISSMSESYWSSSEHETSSIYDRGMDAWIEYYRRVSVSSYTTIMPGDKTTSYRHGNLSVRPFRVF